jgi:hypothetical protein
MTKDELLTQIGKQVPYFNNYAAVRDAVDAYTDALLKQCNVSGSLPCVHDWLYLPNDKYVMKLCKKCRIEVSRQ